MKQESLDKILKIVENAIKEGNTARLEWLIDFFKKLYEDNKYIEEIINGTKPIKDLQGGAGGLRDTDEIITIFQEGDTRSMSCGCAEQYKNGQWIGLAGNGNCKCKY